MNDENLPPVGESPATPTPPPWDPHEQPTGPLPATVQDTGATGTGAGTPDPTGSGSGGLPPAGGSNPPDGTEGDQGRSGESKFLAILALVVVGLMAVLGVWWLFAGGGSTGGGDTASATASPTVPVTTVAEAVATTPVAAVESPATPMSPSPTRLLPPAPAIGGSTTTTVGRPVTFTGEDTSGGETGPAGYWWDFGDGMQAQGAVVTHAYDLPGQFVVRLTITADDGQSGTTAQAILVQPSPQNPPQAVIRGPTSGKVAQVVTFDGSASTAGSAPITTYNWDFGDGTRGVGQAASHAYAQPGNFRVSLNVVDSNGLTGSASSQIAIQSPKPPAAVIRAPASAKVGETVTFDASGSSSGAPIVAYLWTFGDGGATDAVVAQHAYDTADDYQLTLTVIDQTGARNMASTRINVTASAAPSPPTAVISGPTTAAVGQSVTFDASGSKTGGSPITRYDWTLTGPSTQKSGAGATFTTVFDLPGAYSVSLLVTDSAGQSDSASQAVQVSGTLESVVWYLDNANPPITLSIGSGTASGTTGCNTYQLTFTPTGTASSGTLALGPVSRTNRECPGQDPAKDDDYFATLEDANAYSISGNRLTLSGTGGNLAYTGRTPQQPSFAPKQ